jgi:large subunit ribosomal protein L32
MALPKRRTSKARKRKRRTHWKLTAPNSGNRCSHCGAAARPHRVCPECGHYGERRVIQDTE